ncbi:MAG: glycosyltransferase family 9 protein [Candidatus Omnitrophota bacterium]
MPTSKQLAYGSLFFVAAGLAFSIGLFNTAVSVLIGLALISVMKRRDFSVFRQPFAAFLLAYLILNLLSLSQTDYALASARGVVKVLKNIFLCLAVFYVVDSKDKFLRIFQWLLVVGFIIGVDALIQGATGVELLRGRDMTAFHGETKRLTGPFRHANDFSAYLSFTVLLFAGAVRYGREIFSRRGLFFLATGLVVLFVCLVGTYSRGAWVAVGAAFCLYAVFTRSKILIGGLVLLAVWGAFFSPPLVRSRALSLFDAQNNTIQERKELWSESLRMIQKSPWLGLGVNTYAKNEPLYKAEGSKSDNQYAHNGYLQMASEIGLLGLAAFLAAMGFLLVSTVLVFVRGRPHFVKSAGLALIFGILAFLIHSATDTNLQSLLLINMLWFAAGLAWAARRISIEEREVHRILFVRTDRMGDVLMNLPAIRLLRQTHPKAWITLLTGPSVAGLLKGHSDVDEVMTVNASSLKQSFRSCLELARHLRQARFDLAVVSNPDKWLHLAVFLADIPERAGWRHKWSFLLTKSREEARDKNGRHQMDWNLDLMRLVSGDKWDGKLSLPLNEAAKLSVEELLKSECPGEGDLVVVHPGTSNPSKRWPREKFAELCGRLRSEGLRVVLIGGPEEAEISSRVARSSGAVNWAGRLSLPELTAFLGNPRVRCLVSSDSGPAHIAWIQGTPVVALYAKNEPGSDPSRWGPRDPASEVIYKNIGEIAPEEVHQAVKKVMQKKKVLTPC